MVTMEIETGAVWLACGERDACITGTGRAYLSERDVNASGEGGVPAKTWADLAAVCEWLAEERPFLVTAKCRRAGAIGVHFCHEVTVQVSAVDEQDASDKAWAELYRVHGASHEHFGRLDITGAW